MHAASVWCDANAAGLVERRGPEGRGKKNRKMRPKVRKGQSQGGNVQFYRCSPWSDPTLRTTSASGNGLQSKTGTMRIRARAGRGDCLIVSAVSHCSMGKASILSGERVFLQGRGQRKAGFIAESCKA